MNHRVNAFSIYRNVSPIVRLFIVSDIMFLMGRLGLIYPVFAVYITDKIQDGNLEVVGIATTIFLLSKSLLQIPISAIIDNIKGEIDDFWVMYTGSFMLALLPLLYIFVDTALGLYLVQFFYGLAGALAFPSWMAIFTRHIDKKREGVEWSMYFSITDLATAAAASLGGFIAFRYGFGLLFIFASALSFIGLFFLFSARNLLRTKK